MISGSGVIDFAFVRIDPDDNGLLDGIHRIEQAQRFHDAPVATPECLVGEEEILTVLHVEHRVTPQRVLPVSRRVEDTEMMPPAGGVCELEELAFAAALVRMEMR